MLPSTWSPVNVREINENYPFTFVPSLSSHHTPIFHVAALTSSSDLG